MQCTENNYKKTSLFILKYLYKKKYKINEIFDTAIYIAIYIELKKLYFIFPKQSEVIAIEKIKSLERMFHGTGKKCDPLITWLVVGMS